MSSIKWWDLINKMRILSMHVLHKKEGKAIFLSSAYAIDFVGYLKKGLVRDSLKFGARTTVSKMKKGELIRLEVEEPDNTDVYAHINDQNIATVVICDKEYPESAALKILHELQNNFLSLYNPDMFKQYSEDQEIKFPSINDMIKKYQDPKEADKLIKIESDLEEIQTALHKTMADLMDRGERLDDLMKQSEDISGMAYTFYSKSKAANQKCCSLY